MGKKPFTIGRKAFAKISAVEGIKITTETIRVEIGAELSPGVFQYSVPSLRLCGKSRQPLLDACRQIKSIPGDTSRQIARTYWKDKSHWAMSCPVDVGATLTVREPDKGSPTFVTFVPFKGVT